MPFPSPKREKKTNPEVPQETFSLSPGAHVVMSGDIICYHNHREGGKKGGREERTSLHYVEIPQGVYMSVEDGHVNIWAQVSVTIASVVIKVLEEHKEVNDSFGK